MSLGTHAAIGAIIISKFPNHPVLGFCLAFGSHFILDAIPHWDYHLSSLQENEGDLMKNRMPITGKFLGDVFKMGTDLLLGAAAALWFFSDRNPVLILFGIAGGVLPDFMQFLYFHIQKEPLIIIQRFHMWIHTKNKMKNAATLSVVSQVAIVLALFYLTSSHSAATVLFQTSSPTLSPVSSGNILQNKNITIADAKSRITKKTFGLFVSPQNSPVSPEKFTGYHTGTDFETLSVEENEDISIYALCDGTLVLKKYATGYGGVVVQECTLDGQEVTVVYGHLKLASITSVQGAVLKRGDLLGILGKGYSSETDGERKHLHLGIHKGTAINILGYVQKSSELSSWLDPAPFLY